VLTLPEVQGPDSDSQDDYAIVFDDVTITRTAPPDSEHVKNNQQRKNKAKLTKVEKKEQKKAQRQRAQLSSMEKLISSTDSEVVSFELDHINLSIKKVISEFYIY
jgi:hypothetical protein